MNRVMDRLLRKCATMAFYAAVTAQGAPSLWWLHQPKTPEVLKQLCIKGADLQTK